MTNSVYAQNAQRVTRAIRDTFLSGQYDKLPALSQEYTQATLELIQAEGHWAIGSDASISLHEVAEQLLGHRTKEGYSLFDSKNRDLLATAFVEYLPVSVHHAKTLLARSEPSMEKLVTKLMKANLEYQLGSSTGLPDLVDLISSRSQAQADRLITDILDGKTQLGRSADLLSMVFVIRTGLSHNKPSEPMLASIRVKEGEILKHIGIGDANAKIKAINDSVKMPVGVLSQLKLAGCDALLDKLINIGGIDYKGAGTLSGFFSTGGKLPDTFISAALTSANRGSDLKFVFAEALATNPVNLHTAVRFIDSDRANLNAEVWLKSLGDAITHLKKEGMRFERKDVVDLIEPVAAKVANRAILKGAALASGIEGIYLSIVPSLKEFKGEFIHQELGL